MAFAEDMTAWGARQPSSKFAISPEGNGRGQGGRQKGAQSAERSGVEESLRRLHLHELAQHDDGSLLDGIRRLGGRLKLAKGVLVLPVL